MVIRKCFLIQYSYSTEYPNCYPCFQHKQRCYKAVNKDKAIKKWRKECCGIMYVYPFIDRVIEISNDNYFEDSKYLGPTWALKLENNYLVDTGVSIFDPKPEII